MQGELGSLAELSQISCVAAAEVDTDLSLVSLGSGLLQLEEE